MKTKALYFILILGLITVFTFCSKKDTTPPEISVSPKTATTAIGDTVHYTISLKSTTQLKEFEVTVDNQKVSTPYSFPANTNESTLSFDFIIPTNLINGALKSGDDLNLIFSVTNENAYNSADAVITVQ